LGEAQDQQLVQPHLARAVVKAREQVDGDAPQECSVVDAQGLRAATGPDGQTQGACIGDAQQFGWGGVRAGGQRLDRCGRTGPVDKLLPRSWQVIWPQRKPSARPPPNAANSLTMPGALYLAPAALAPTAPNPFITNALP